MYILQINSKAFVKDYTFYEVVISSDSEKAKKFEREEDAIRIAAAINSMLEKAIVYPKSI